MFGKDVQFVVLTRHAEWLGLVLAALVMIPGSPQVRGADPSEFSTADLEFFEKEVRPILVARCYECHSGKKDQGGLRVDSRQAIITGGATGPAVVPGDPKQ